MTRTTMAAIAAVVVVVAIAAAGRGEAAEEAADEEGKADGGEAAEEASVAAPASPWELSGFFGLRVFSGDSGLGRSAPAVNGSETDNTVPFGPRLGYRLNDLFSLEGELLVMPTQTASGAAGLGVFGLRAQGVYYPLDESERFRPLVAAGVGVDLQVSDNDAVIDDGAVVLAHLGVGARFRLSDQFGVRADARFLLGPALDGSFTAGHGELLFSAYFSFGGGRAASADDDEPVKKEPTPEDDDADGVPDTRDDCPRRAEDVDGQDDDDGCPESDEDVDGDGDGVLGSLDVCPKDKENENDYQDDDGCPDQPPAVVADYTGTIEGVSFKSGSAKIVKGSYVILDRVAKVLSDNPDFKVVIVGHTDDRGARTKNVALSLARAQAVKDYLVTLGIAEERLSAEGRGPDQPLEDNTTASGRSRNRRIEFQISGKLANPAGGPPKPERP